MCGIAGIIYRDGTRDVGRDMTRMLQSMKHRGPDSTGYALYGQPHDGQVVMRYTLADANTPRDFEFDDRIQRHQTQVVTRLKAAGARIEDVEPETEYAYRTTLTYGGDLKDLTDRIEDIPDAEVLSIGRSLEIIKDLGDAETVSEQYGLGGFEGTHAIGHVCMATESDVDISGAHTYWAYPFSDLAEKISEGADLEQAMQQSLEELDGVFTYIAVTADALGVAKDEMAAKPLVLYEADDVVALASEEIAIRAIVDHEIDTYDPYEGMVMAWQR